ncbi:2,4-dihydroxyhept-2-ene-1,7-dioic acid aldolase [Mycena venus]|uniref:2,4-dihydroxyhept-2-ene-1,7-dioic acid aldolase n=1 Tax=Mycena venus TaxID=2733690 RepID=A0A8H6YJA7_9AGAR|nr:2,4-dihydroxyhept-2-ene-1,7-dioic acid aldolase [Mycena venus]
MNPTPRRFTLDTASQELYRPLTLQQPSNLRGLIKTGKVVISTSLSYPSRHVAKTVAVTGADLCWLDAEHVAWSPKLLVECIQTIIHESGGRMIPVVRVPSKTSFDYMAWCLDAGAGGIIVPHMETVEEMQDVINACCFPPAGHRSFPPFTFIPGVTDTTLEGESVFSVANQHVAIIPQIESPLGIQNLDEIVALDEVSAFMIGHGDLRLEMGFSLAATGTEPGYVEAVQKAKKVAQDRGKSIVGPAAGPEMIKLRIEQGYRIIVCCLDLHTFAFGMMKTVSEGRAVAEEHMQKIHGSGEGLQ